MLKIGLIFGSILICFGQIDCVLNPKVVCYYEFWYVWRFGDAKMTSEDIDSSLCTHIVYAYLGVSSTNEIYIPDPYLMIERMDLSQFSSNKGKAKALAAIGGNMLSGNFSTMINSVANRTRFINDVMSFLVKYNFDGITLDWFDSFNGFARHWDDSTFYDLRELIEGLHQAFDGKYILVMTLDRHSIYNEKKFEGHLVYQFVDFFIVQTYYYSDWGIQLSKVGHQAPLNLQFKSMNELEDTGIPPNKLLISISTYAQTWILDDPNLSNPGDYGYNNGEPGPFTQARGKLSYTELCIKIEQDPSAWQLKTDPKASGAAYAVNDRQWVSFETITTAGDKAHNITTEGYGGVVVMALAEDDFRGMCGTKYPLLKAINQRLNKEDTTRPPHLSTTSLSVTLDPNRVCKKVGTVRDPQDCNVYHKCTEFFPGVLSDEKLRCPTGEAYDQTDDKCKDKAQVNGCN